MKLAYVAWDKAGKQEVSTLEAPNAAEATETLRRKGLFVTEISQAGEATTVNRQSSSKVGAGKRLKCLTMFTRQLYVLVSSGTPLVQSLGALERQTKEGHWRDTINSIRLRIEEGESLAEAMASAPEYFDAPCRSLISAGESSGKLPEMLDRLATMAQKQQHIRNSIIGATIYPILLLTVAISVLTMMLLFVVPRFADLFATLGVPLPATTKSLLWISFCLKSYWWAILGGMVGLGVGAKWYLATPEGKRVRDTVIINLPQFGKIVKSFATARIVRLLGILLEGDVPILDALDMTVASVGNCHYADLMTKARDAVSQGESIGSAFKDSDLISPSVYETIRNGEQSGQLGTLLLNVAGFLEEENEVIVRSLTSIIEPVILVVMGGLVGLVAISMFTPLFDLTSMAGG